jgi:hypothetical protein
MPINLILLMQKQAVKEGYETTNSNNSTLPFQALISSHHRYNPMPILWLVSLR